jgi:hypothetical protein
VYYSDGIVIKETMNPVSCFIIMYGDRCDFIKCKDWCRVVVACQRGREKEIKSWEKRSQSISYKSQQVQRRGGGGDNGDNV